MFARSLLLFLGSVAAASAFVTPLGNAPSSSLLHLRTSGCSVRRPAVSALRMQQSPIKLTPKLFSELDTDGSGTISAAEVSLVLFCGNGSLNN